MKQTLARVLYRMAVSMKKVAALFIPVPVMQRIKRILLKSAFPVEPKRTGESLQIEAMGINLIGYARAEMGIGESCRIAAKSLTAGNIPFGIINFIGTTRARMTDLAWIHKEINAPVYGINLFHINAEQIPEIKLMYGNSMFENRYNIGYWHWELPDFPDKWLESFKYLDEIWVPSTFVWSSISLKSPVPVVKIPHSIELKISESRDRTYFGLPQEAFLFLTMYDVNSFQERKNPQASINAFKKSFGPNDMQVGLVVKVNGFKRGSKEAEELMNLVGDYKNVYLITDTISRNDINALIAISNCFISLHRSEGFGLGFAEAMYLGKPVIGTNWSSNTDFMNYKNACIVDYSIINLGKDYGPYKAYQQWADPSIQHASEYMVKLVNDKGYYDSIASSGQTFIQENYSPQAIGELINKRLGYIIKSRFGG